MIAGTETGVKHLVLRYAPLKKMGNATVGLPRMVLNLCRRPATRAAI
jgi:hypothetical protein